MEYGGDSSIRTLAGYVEIISVMQPRKLKLTSF